MKKIFLAFLFCLISVHVFAQVSEADKINNEYYGLKWGCSVKDLKAKYPEAYSNGTNDNGDELYYLDTNGATRIFFFGNGKLYIGRIAYTDCTDEKVMGLMKKITDTYGKFDDSNKGSQNGNEYINFVKYFSPKIEIDFQLMSVKNSYGYNISQVVMITYTNNELAAQIARERISKMQEDLEL